MKEFILNMFQKNTYLYFHVFCAGLFSWVMKFTPAPHMSILTSVITIAIGYEVLQYVDMKKDWKGWSWTPYRSKAKWLADMLGDIVSAVLISYWILY